MDKKIKCCKCHKVMEKGEGRYNLARLTYCIECWDKERGKEN